MLTVNSKSFLLITFIFCSSLSAEVCLERAIEERFEKEFSSYDCERKTKKVAKIIGVGALSAGAVALGSYVIYKAWNHTEPPKSAGVAPAGVEKPGTFFGKMQNAFISVTALTIAATIVKSIYSGIFSGGSALIGLINPGTVELDPYFVPLKTRIWVSLDRLSIAMSGWEGCHDRDSLMSKHYLSEIQAAFKIFVLSLEKLSVILLSLAQLSKKDPKTLSEDCRSSTKRLFLFCNQIATTIESDLNKKEWKGFSQSVKETIATLATLSFSFISYHSTTCCDLTSLDGNKPVDGGKQQGEK